MMDPLWLKYAHVLGAILIFGTGLGTAFHLVRAPEQGAAGGCRTVGRSTVWADWLFTYRCRAAAGPRCAPRPGPMAGRCSSLGS